MYYLVVTDQGSRLLVMYLRYEYSLYCWVVDEVLENVHPFALVCLTTDKRSAIAKKYICITTCVQHTHTHICAYIHSYIHIRTYTQK